MRFQLQVNTSELAGGKDAGANILFADLTSEYKVYAFYYPGLIRDATIEGQLKELGERSDKNLLVNIGSYGDPEFDVIVNYFGITKYPVLVMTALESLASSQEEYMTAFVRLDNEDFWKSRDRAVNCVLELFNLFLKGSVAEAVSHAKWTQRTESLKRLGSMLGGVLSKIAGFVLDRDLSFSFAAFKLELKKAK